FRRARDLMIEAAVVFQSQLAEILAELDASGVIRLGSRVGPEALAQLLCDGARGSNQALPPIPLEQLRPRYAAVIEAILFGSVAKG
ncbi:MAG: TetR/AcrR family transcriptional regulator, partial [Devosia nanyangense]|nr:TetR/AcrR family transcriptional regulator [Devosia nanyangense]